MCIEQHAAIRNKEKLKVHCSRIQHRFHMLYMSGVWVCVRLCACLYGINWNKLDSQHVTRRHCDCSKRSSRAEVCCTICLCMGGWVSSSARKENICAVVYICYATAKTVDCLFIFFILQCRRATSNVPVFVAVVSVVVVGKLHEHTLRSMPGEVSEWAIACGDGGACISSSAWVACHVCGCSAAFVLCALPVCLRGQFVEWTERSVHLIKKRAYVCALLCWSYVYLVL